MRRSTITVLGLALFALLSVLCLRRQAPRIEAELAERARSRLESAGLPAHLVEVDGRDARLAAGVSDPDLARRAVAAVAGLRGLRRIDERLRAGTVAGPVTPRPVGAPAAGGDREPDPAPATRPDRVAAPPVFELRLGPSRVELTGRLPDRESRDVVLAAVGPPLGAGALDDRLEVAPDAPPPVWLDRATDIADALYGRLVTGELTVEEGAVRVRGRVTEAAAGEEIVARLAAAFPRREVIDELEVAPLSAVARDLQTRLDELIAERRIEFRTSSVELTRGGMRALDRVAEVLAELAEPAVEISGHTDSRGAPEMNLDLSRQRADVVRRYLVEQGIDPGRLRALGLGSRRPIADNGTIAGRRRNRRIELKVLPGGAA